MGRKKLITIEIVDKVATCLTDSPIVCWNSNYVANFIFDEEWDDYEEKTAFFIVNGVTLPPVVFKGNQCPIPKLLKTNSVLVGVCAGDLYTTTKALVKCRKSIRCVASEPQEPTPDVYAQIMQMINDGKIKGADGKDGKDGETPDMSAYYTKEETDQSIAKVENDVALLNNALLQSDTIYKAETEAAYTERVTADGANVLDGSKALLKKVVGSTVVYDGKLVNASFAGIKSGGRNLFDYKNFLSWANSDIGTSGEETTYLGEKCFSFTPWMSSADFVFTDIKFKENTQYTFSLEAACYVKGYDSYNMNVFYVLYTDGTGDYIHSSAAGVLYRDKFVKITFTSDEGKTIKGLKIPRFGKGNFIYVKTDMQINVGATELPYMPYIDTVLPFPKTETPLGTTIDFENKKITDYGVDLVLTGNENFVYYKYGTEIRNSIAINDLSLLKPTSGAVKTPYVSTDSVYYGTDYTPKNIFAFFANFTWLDILDTLGFTTRGTEPTAEEQATAIENFKAYLAQRYADGNPVTIRYVSSTLQSETDFTAENEYTAYKGGTEKVLDNDGNEYGADNTLTQNYIVVKE